MMLGAPRPLRRLAAKVRPLPPQGLNLPRRGAKLERGLTPVAGWAVGEVDRVEVLVDGHPVLRARTGLPTASVALSHATPQAHIAGFSALLDLGSVPSDTGEVEVAAVAHLADGKSVSVGSRIVRLHPERHHPPLPPVPPPPEARRPRSKPLRVLAMTHDLGLGGGQLYLQELLLRLLDRGDREITVTSPRDGPLRAELESRGVEVRIIRDPPVRRLRGYERRVGQLATEFAAGGFDAAIANTMSVFGAVDAATRAGIPVAWAIHESFPLTEFWWHAYGPGTADRGVIERGREALARADALVFEADATRHMYERHVEPGRARTVRYGIDLSQVAEFRARVSRSAARESLGIEPAALVVICVATVEPRKGQTGLCRAFAEAASGNPDALLVVLGDRPTDYSRALHAYLADAGVTNVRTEPVTGDIYTWLAAADLFALSSDVESMPRSILEAMAFDLPVLATDVFGVGELLTDGETGFLVPALDQAALRNRLHDLVSGDRQRLEQVGRNAGDLVRANHDSSGYASAFAALLEEMAQGS